MLCSGRGASRLRQQNGHNVHAQTAYYRGGAHNASMLVQAMYNVVDSYCVSQITAVGCYRPAGRMDAVALAERGGYCPARVPGGRGDYLCGGAGADIEAI